MIPYGRQDITQADIDAVIDVLRSDYLTQGPLVPQFEGALRDYAGAEYAVAVNSATSALHLACLALGVGPGDVVWTSPVTFVASANCALYCGADVDFIDVDPISGLMSTEALAAKFHEAERAGRLPKVIIPVHLTGRSCPMQEIRSLADRYGAKVIEDASHAVGARHAGDMVGLCAHSDVTVFSFHPVKIITTGEGGVALTNDPGLAAAMERGRTHGITREEGDMVGDSHGPWYYQQIELGYNYRMTDIQAGLGLSQLRRLDAYVARRNELAGRYRALLGDTEVILPPDIPLSDRSSWHLYVIHVPQRRRVFDALRDREIGVQVHYIPVHTQPFYRRLGFAPASCPNAMKYYESALTIPLHPTMTEEDQDSVVEALLESLA